MGLAMPKTEIIRQAIQQGHSINIGRETARIEERPMKEWAAELAKIEDEADRAAVRANLKTVQRLIQAANAVIKIQNQTYSTEA